jgi:hypothetical protein
MQLLGQLAQVPRLFGLPVIAAALRRDAARLELAAKRPDISVKSATSITHAYAFADAMRCTDHWMRNNAKNEVAMVIAEKAGRVESAIEKLHEGYSDPTVESDNGFKSAHIVEAISFVPKTASVLLQIADHCSFILKRALSGKADTTALANHIFPMVHTGATAARGYVIAVHPSHLTPVSPAQSPKAPAQTHGPTRRRRRRERPL